MPTAKAVKTETRELPMLTLRAAFAPSTFDEAKRTVELVWTTGAKGLRRGYWEDYYEELSLDAGAVRMDRLNDGAPLLAAHDAYSLDGVIGVVERAWLANGEGRAVVRFSERDEVAPIIKDVRSGVLRNISVGYNVYRYEVIQDVNTDLDTYRAVDWEPMELSIVPINFDAGAKVRAGEKHATHPVVITRGAAATEDREMANENTAEAAAEQKRLETARTEGSKAERERAAAIRTAVRAALLTDALADQLINDGVALDAARAQIIDKMADKQRTEQGDTRGPHAIEAGKDASDKWREGARNWLIEKAGVRGMFANEKFDPGEFRGLTLVDLARDSLERAGVRTRGMHKMDLVGLALTRGAGGYNGISDFAVLLENTMHKVLLGAFATAPDTWRQWCKIGSVTDFRPFPRYRLGSFGTLDAVNENGEFRQKQIPDGTKEKISASTKGNIIGLTRQSIINDDMGAFDGMATSLGRAAGLSIEVDAYASLTSNSGLGPKMNDGNNLFDASHSNLGTGSALGVAALDADRVVMASQKDPSGNEILDLRPSVLVLPVGLGGQARVINNSQYDTDAVTTNATNKFQVPNKVVGLFRTIVDTPRISGTRRYMFADPSIAPCIEVVFLEGQQTPFLDNQLGWRVDGVEWKVRIDYGVGGVGYQGAVTNAGQ